MVRILHHKKQIEYRKIARMIWKVKPNAEAINGAPGQNMTEHLGIQITEVTDEYIAGSMPVDHRTMQPFGLLHGGASCVLAETLGSIGGTFCVEPQKQIVVGLEINANHLRSAQSGHVHGVARPIHLGRSTQVWDIQIRDDHKNLVCVSRLTLAVKNL